MSAAVIRRCRNCGSHFEQLADEWLCSQCTLWAEILARRDSYRRALRVRGRR